MGNDNSSSSNSGGCGPVGGLGDNYGDSRFGGGGYSGGGYSRGGYSGGGWSGGGGVSSSGGITGGGGVSSSGGITGGGSSVDALAVSSMARGSSYDAGISNARSTVFGGSHTNDTAVGRMSEAMSGAMKSNGFSGNFEMSGGSSNIGLMSSVSTNIETRQEQTIQERDLASLITEFQNKLETEMKEKETAEESVKIQTDFLDISKKVIDSDNKVKDICRMIIDKALTNYNEGKRSRSDFEKTIRELASNIPMVSTVNTTTEVIEAGTHVSNTMIENNRQKNIDFMNSANGKVSDETLMEMVEEH
jgi:hypothetical protein